MASRFNGKFRDECLSFEWFRSRAEAKVMIEAWRRHYNDVRPHSSLGYHVAWTLQNRGSKYWQEAWEQKVNAVEAEILGVKLFLNREPFASKGTLGCGRIFGFQTDYCAQRFHRNYLVRAGYKGFPNNILGDGRPQIGQF
jgi:hypothetical protein